MTTTPTPLDYLKYVSAEGRHLLEYVIDRLGGLDLDRPLREDAIEELQTMLDEVRDMLVEATSTFCPTPRDVNTYSDGRRKVETFVEMECGNIFGYRWHPNPTSPGNRARTLLDRHECTVIIAADQVLDVVTHERGLHLVDNHE